MNISSMVFFGTLLLGVLIVVLTQIITGELQKTCISLILSAMIVSISTFFVLNFEKEQKNTNTRNQIMVAMASDYDYYVGGTEVENIDQTILDHIEDYSCIIDHESKKIILTPVQKEKQIVPIPLLVGGF